MKRVESKDYSGSYTAISLLHGFGVFVVVVGVILALMGAASGNIAVSRFGGNSGGGGWGAIMGMMPGISVVVSGIFIIAFAKMAEANVHTAEMTQEILRLTLSRSGGGAKDRKDVPVEKPKSMNGKVKTTYAKSAEKAAARAQAVSKPRPPAGDNPDMAEG
jgi:uncharacterized membrane protein